MFDVILKLKKPKLKDDLINHFWLNSNVIRRITTVGNHKFQMTHGYERDDLQKTIELEGIKNKDFKLEYKAKESDSTLVYFNNNKEESIRKILPSFGLNNTNRNYKLFCDALYELEKKGYVLVDYPKEGSFKLSEKGLNHHKNLSFYNAHLNLLLMRLSLIIALISLLSQMYSPLKDFIINLFKVLK